MLRELKHTVKGASRINTIIGMIAIILIQSNVVWRSWDERGVIYASLTVVVLCLIVLILAVYQTYLKKPTELCLSSEQIILNGKIINSRDIKMIMTRGYFKPSIGILPSKRKIVPVDMAFRYLKDEDKDITDLKSWANMNNVKMVNKSFQTWI